jgi:hypothetical protein
MFTQSLYASNGAGDLDLGANQTTGNLRIGVIQASGDVDIGLLADRTGAINIGTGASATHTTTLGNVGQTTSITNIHAGTVAVESHGTTLDLTANTTATLSGNVVGVDATAGNLALTSTAVASMTGASATLSSSTSTVAVSAATKATLEGNAVAVDAASGNVGITASGTVSTDAAVISLETSAGDLTLETNLANSVIANGYSMRAVSGEVTNLASGSPSINNPGYSTATYWNWGPMWVINGSIYWTSKNESIGNDDEWRIKGMPVVFPSGSNSETHVIYSKSNWAGCNGSTWLSLFTIPGTDQIGGRRNHSQTLTQGMIYSSSAFKFTIFCCVP